MADFTYARTWGGFVYVFVVDVYAQKIVGWHAAPTKAQRARPDVRPMATWQREHEGHPSSPESSFTITTPARNGSIAGTLHGP